MKKRRRTNPQQDCIIAKAIDKIEEAASTAMKIYCVVEPIVKAILTKGRRIR